MKPITILPENYLDLIFLNRNKNYGAYELRKNYPTTVVKSMGGVMGLMLLLALFIYLHKSETAPIIRPIIDGYHFANIDPNIITPPKPVAPTPPPAARTNAPTNTIPHIVHDEFVTTKPDETTSATTTSTSSGTTTTGATVTGSATTTTTTTTTETIYTPLRWATDMPKFQGDINEYLASHIAYPEMAKASNVQGKVVIEFVVNENGSISNLRLVKGIGSGCDEEAMNVIRNMPQWIPGKQNGTPVKIYLMLPITFKLD
jgi:protein TonB